MRRYYGEGAGRHAAYIDGVGARLVVADRELNRRALAGSQGYALVRLFWPLT